MRDDASEDLRFVGGLRSQFGIKVLQLYLLAAEVVGEATKGRASVFFSLFMSKGVCFESVRI
jgi:hypothetical protein